MVKKTHVPQADLDTVLAWLAELDTADSYAGFTTTAWTLRRPVDAIQRLNEARSGD